MTFSIQRGTNISEWLSQSEQRGVERAAKFSEADVRLIARLGFDHIRLPVDEEQLWDARGVRDPEAFGLLDAALDWCEQYGLRVVVDLHILRTHYFNQGSQPALFTDPAEEARFAGLWSELSAHLGRRSTSQVAYEPLNEAVARNPHDWNRVLHAAYQAIRQREPERTVVMGSNWFNQVQAFDMLKIPSGDQHLILTFHYYRPMLVTHYRAPWWDGGFYGGPVRYPGLVVSESDLGGLTRDQREVVLGESKGVWNRQRIAEDFIRPVAAALRTGLPLYCGEWGAYQTTPLETRLAWYRDMLAVFKELHIAWANWDYRGGFAPVSREGQPSEIVDTLMAAY